MRKKIFLASFILSFMLIISCFNNTKTYASENDTIDTTLISDRSAELPAYTSAFDGGESPISRLPKNYYGNGLYGDENGTYIDYNHVWNCVARYSIGGWFGAVPGKC